MKRDWLHVAFEDKFATLCQLFERVELGRLFLYYIIFYLFIYDQLLIKQQLIMIFWKWVQISNNSIQGQ